MIKFLFLDVLPHIFFILFILCGIGGIISSICATIAEKDWFYIPVSFVFISVLYGSVAWYGVYLGQW